MSDSLKDQLLQAGFKATTPSKKKNSTNHRAGGSKKPHAKSAQQLKLKETAAMAAAKAAHEQAEAIEKRKALKAQIRTLIEAHKVDKHQGDIAHSYTLGTRIKQIFVNETVRNGIVAGELFITRLNGATYVVPADIGEQILVLNPEWVVVKPSDKTVDESEEYAEFKVPDDLQW